MLRRQIGQVRYQPGDRLWLAALSRLVPRRRWAEVFAVTPATLLARRRRLVTRKWDYTSRRRPGRPSTRAAIRKLVIRMSTDNPTWGLARLEAGQDGCQCLGAGGGRSVDRGDDVSGLQAGLSGRRGSDNAPELPDGAALVLAGTRPVVAASLATGREGVSGARAAHTLAYSWMSCSNSATSSGVRVRRVWPMACRMSPVATCSSPRSNRTRSKASCAVRRAANSMSAGVNSRDSSTIAVMSNWPCGIAVR